MSKQSVTTDPEQVISKNPEPVPENSSVPEPENPEPVPENPEQATDKYAKLRKAFQEAPETSEEGFDNDLMEIFQSNIGKLISIDIIAEALSKKTPKKSNLHSFVWAMNNKLKDTDGIHFGYSTKGGLFLKVNKAK